MRDQFLVSSRTRSLAAAQVLNLLRLQWAARMLIHRRLLLPELRLRAGRLIPHDERTALVHRSRIALHRLASSVLRHTAAPVGWRLRLTCLN